MAKTLISFKNYEEPTWEEYTGEDPPANRWFNAKATRIKYLEEDDQIMVVFEITEGDFKGWGRGFYAPLDPEHDLYWKTHQLIKALQGGKTQDVSVDFENDKMANAWLAKQKPVKLKTREYNSNISINKVAPLLEAVPVGRGTAPKADEPADEPVGDEELSDYTEDELAEMEVADLEEILTDEFELAKDDEDFPVKGSGRGAAAKYKKELVQAILAEQDADEEDGEAEADGDGEETDEEFEDGFEGDDADEEDEPEPEPAPRARRSRTAAAKPAPAAKATSTRRRRS